MLPVDQIPHSGDEDEACSGPSLRLPCGASSSAWRESRDGVHIALFSLNWTASHRNLVPERIRFNVSADFVKITFQGVTVIAVFLNFGQEFSLMYISEGDSLFIHSV